VTIITFHILRRASPIPSLVNLKQDTYSHSTTQEVSDGVYGGDPFSHRSLSQTFVRHSLKSPTKMFDSKETSNLQSLTSTSVRDRRDSGNRFSSFGQESVSSLASEGIPRFERVKLVGGHQVHVHDPWPSDTRSRRDFGTGQSFPRSVTESTVYETGSMPDLSTISQSMVEALGYPSQDPARREQNRIQRAKSDPRLAQLGGEGPKLKLSAHELRRMRTFSSPERNSCADSDGKPPAMEMPGYLISRRPRLTISPPSEAGVDSPRSSNEQESDLARQMSQRAVLFYQEHANSHLSLPLGGPLSSTVLPDSPSVIGNSESPRRVFSLA